MQAKPTNRNKLASIYQCELSIQQYIHLAIWTCTDMHGFTHLSIEHHSTLNSQFQHLKINIQNVADSGYISTASFFLKQHLKSKLQVARVC